MDVALRRLRAEDIEQVIEIEREAFTPLWLGTSFKRELNNRYARYLVACQPEPADRGIEASEAVTDDPVTGPGEGSTLGVKDSPDASIWGRMVRGVREIVKKEPAVNPVNPEDAELAGYVGIWFQGNEAHITEIAVREKLRGKGIGELLLIGSVYAAQNNGSIVLTLEARVSNFIAQRLYEKYGFKQVGIRKGYYSDNREDAVIMTTGPIHSNEYQELFGQLQDKFRSRWGDITING